ncbi:endonuclease I family protein [Gayadomonas joobiniege]|uniref:endonuclease I family protein n=1 Tax=Gayadomonas joobiniege TaxID=1234606 RepID=UPI00036AE96C|nr:endonuclease [Gayadomonas joobiniege]
MRLTLFTAALVLLAGCNGEEAIAPSQDESIEFDTTKITYASSFDKAQDIAEYTIYKDSLKSFYCSCDIVFDDTQDYDGDGNKTESMIMPQSCGYTPRKATTSSGKPNARASRVEWEHVVPASLMAGHLPEWKDKNTYSECKKSNGKYLSGRDCAYKLVPWFKNAHNDLHNLVPAVGELNGDRSNRKYGIVSQEPRAYGACDFEVDFSTDLAEPADSIKGNVARIYKYMHAMYKFPITNDEVKLFSEWDKLDPVDAEECARDARIKAVQGNSNPFVSTACSN